MNIDIRKNIISNFKDAKEDEIKASIISAIEEKDEGTLPGMGVFFELLWENSNTDEKEFILRKIKEKL